MMDTLPLRPFYRAAALGLRALDGRGVRRRFGEDADARWRQFRGELRDADRFDLLLRDADGPVIDITQGYWTRFATGANPNGMGAVNWPVFTTAGDAHLDISATPVMGAGLRRSQCDVITPWLAPPM